MHYRNFIRRLLGVYFVIFLAQCSIADTWDPQDDAGATAPLLVPSQTFEFHGPHTLDSVDTNDWFRVYLTSGIPCQVESTGTLDTKAFLYSDFAGTIEVANNDQDGEDNNFMLRYLPETSGTYYLKVREFVIGEGGSYSLKYGFYSADEWDPMDNIGTNVTVLTMGEAVKIHGPHILDPFDHYDWFRIKLSSGVGYRFESVGGSDTWGGIYSDLLDPSDEGADIYNDDGPVDNNFQFDYFPPVTEYYYLKVRAYVEGDYDSYNLRYYVPADDSDGDQLPDYWEEQYFTNLTYGPVEPPGDSDMQSNLEEYIAGTDPTDSNSFFAITNSSTGSFVVEWTSVEGREYKVLWAETLTNNFEPIDLVMEYPQNSYTDAEHSADSSGFYKVEVQLSP